MQIRAFVAGIAGSFALATAAAAADPVIIAAPSPPPMVIAPAGFNWAGPYAGADIVLGGAFGLGGQFGFNVVRGRLLFGGEGWVAFAPGPGGFLFAAMGKVGFLFGPTDRALVYGTAGISPVPGGPDFFAGGGGAVGIGQRLSVFGEALAVVGAGCCFYRAGVNLHFGR